MKFADLLRLYKCDPELMKESLIILVAHSICQPGTEPSEECVAVARATVERMYVGVAHTPEIRPTWTVGSEEDIWGLPHGSGPSRARK